MDENFLKQEFEYVAHKLDLSKDELQELFKLPKNIIIIIKIKDGLLI
jgi:hypothetical protein